MSSPSSNATTGSTNPNMALSARLDRSAYAMGALAVQNGFQLTDGRVYVWVQDDIAGMSRSSCATSHACATTLRRYRMRDDGPLVACMREGERGQSSLDVTVLASLGSVFAG